MVAGDDERPVIIFNDYEKSPEEISAAILRKMSYTVERVLGEKITKAVITVPAHFND